MERIWDGFKWAGGREAVFLQNSNRAPVTQFFKYCLWSVNPLQGLDRTGAIYVTVFDLWLRPVVGVHVCMFLRRGGELGPWQISKSLWYNLSLALVWNNWESTSSRILYIQEFFQLYVSIDHSMQPMVHSLATWPHSPFMTLMSFRVPWFWMPFSNNRTKRWCYTCIHLIVSKATFISTIAKNDINRKDIFLYPINVLMFKCWGAPRTSGCRTESLSFFLCFFISFFLSVSVFLSFFFSCLLAG